ncbi:MAG TPA: 16S rRNA (cytidine(1402)-2'-O)-methyltransferase [Xanthomonadaceae bacterium]|nr:16S rRNA (cytidine(1402)-2'-O)-methyltransferase [Xanthomonadaceae bacterium]
MAGAGKLWVVATPIGNMGDLAPRAVEVLRDAALILAEDTRHSRTLLAAHGLVTPLSALHEHNERGRLAELVMRLQAGDVLALISDAGTPLVSDPGFPLVRAAREAGIVVSPVPGPCAAIAALSVAGLPTDRFCFEGFLPARSGARRARLRSLAGESRTLVFYESAQRIEDTLGDLCEAFGGERPAVLARELTKAFETVLGDDLEAIRTRVQSDPDQRRGEIVLVVGGVADDEAARLAEGRRLYQVLRQELSPSRAARLAAELSGAPRAALYGGEQETSP